MRWGGVQICMGLQNHKNFGDGRWEYDIKRPLSEGGLKITLPATECSKYMLF